MSDLKKGVEDQILSKGDREDLRSFLRNNPLDNLKAQELEAKGGNLKRTEFFLHQGETESMHMEKTDKEESFSDNLVFATKIPQALRANKGAESQVNFPKPLIGQEAKDNFTIPSKDEFIEKNQQSKHKEPLFDMHIDSLKFSKPLNNTENALEQAQDKLKNSQEHLQKTLSELKNTMANSESLNQEKTSDPLSSSYENKENKLRLEDPFSQDELVTDADKVPVMPTLRDEEVPNRPGAILMHARELLGLSIREVAEKLQLRVNTVNDIEHDRLNQSTAVSFVSVYIGNYARLVNIDPQTLIDLYLQNVEENSQKNIQKQKVSHRLGIKRSFIYTVMGVVVLVAISGGIYKFLTIDKPSENSSGDLLLATNSSKAPAVSGSLPLDVSSQNNAQSVQEESVKRVDPNTQMALAQAQALEQNEDTFAHNSQSIEEIIPNVDEPLTIPGVEIDSGNQFASQKNLNSGAPDFASMKQESLNKAQNANNSNVDQSSNSAKETEDKKLSVKAEIKAPTQESQEVKVDAKEEKVEVRLSNKLKDISSRASLSGREGLASMNNAQISVKGDVALKVTDSRGHVLKQGKFKAGDKISISGIPPLEIQVSDSAKINIRYMGGRVTVPSSKQVSFTLPTK